MNYIRISGSPIRDKIKSEGNLIVTTDHKFPCIIAREFDQINERE